MKKNSNEEKLKEYFKYLDKNAMIDLYFQKRYETEILEAENTYLKNQIKELEESNERLKNTAKSSFILFEKSLRE